MMNTLTKQLIGATFGGAFGLFVAQIVIDYLAYKNDELDQDYEDYEQTEEFPEGDEGDIEDGKETKILFKHNKNAKKVGRVINRNYTQHFISQNRPDLAALAAKYNGGEEPVELINGMTISQVTEEELGLLENQMEDELVASDEFEVEIADDDSVDPRIISMEEYADDTQFAHLTLNYYEDDILTDKNGNPIDRPERVLGDEALVSFGMLSHDDDIVYVRNLEKRAMYEVVRKNKPFSIMPNLRKQQASKRAAKEEEDGEDNNS